MASIERRGNRFRIKVFIGRDGQGKKKWVTRTFPNQRDAKEWGNQTELSHARGTLAEPTKENFATFARRFVDDILSQRVRARTLEHYSDLIRRFVESPPSEFPLIAGTRVDRITTGQIQSLYAAMLRSGLSAGTVRHLHGLVRQILMHADRGSVLQKIQLPKKNQRTPAAMTEDELRRFLQAAREDPYAPVWILLGTCAARPGEVLGLKWTDVDWEGRTIRIERALSRVRGVGWTLTEPKSKRSRRIVPLSELAISTLRRWRKTQAQARLAAGKEWGGHDFIVTTSSGEPAEFGNLRRNYLRVCAEAGGLGEWEEGEPKPKGRPGPRRCPRFIPTYRPYDLRHSVISHLLRHGVDPKSVSELAGHASVSFTYDVYAGSMLAHSGDQITGIMDAILAEEVSR